MDYKDIYMRHMKDNGIKYTEIKENIVRVSYSGDNLPTIAIFVVFTPDDTGVRFVCEDIAKVNQAKRGAGILVCNQLNLQYRWAKFYVCDDGEIRAEMDAVVDAQTVGEECSVGVTRMVSIIDDAYPKIMGALWNE